MALLDRLVVVTKPPELDVLLGRFGSRSAVEFFLRSRGQSIDHFEAESRAYHGALDTLLGALPPVPHATVSRQDLPHFLWREKDLAIAIGPDGLVINVAKYLDGQPIIGVNPNRRTIDGALVRFAPAAMRPTLARVLEGRFNATRIAIAEARVNDGRVLHGVNDFLVGRLDQVSARYRITAGSKTERQSSSGVLVATSIGRGAWLKSVLTGAAGIAARSGAPATVNGTTGESQHPPPWSDRTLVYAVREPFATRATQASIVFGTVAEGERVVIESEMPEGGAIVSDGVVEDFVPFNAGASVVITSSERYVQLVTGVSRWMRGVP